MAVKASTALDEKRALGARIRRIRKAKGIRPVKLARELGVTYTALKFWERGERSVSYTNLLALSRALDVDVADLASPDQDTREGGLR